MMTIDIDIHRELPEYLTRLHATDGLQDEQSCRGATQIRLTGFSLYGLAHDLYEAFDSIVDEPCKIGGLWSTRMLKGGCHISHNHPAGWLSGVCFLNEGDGFAVLKLETGQSYRSKTGQVVLFPSKLRHETTFHLSDTPRLTVAFDLIRADG